MNSAEDDDWGVVFWTNNSRKFMIKGGGGRGNRVLSGTKKVD